MSGGAVAPPVVEANPAKALVMVLFPVICNCSVPAEVPPLGMETVPAPKAFGLVMITVGPPEATVKVLVKVLLLVRTITPAPAVVMPPIPLSTPPKVN